MKHLSRRPALALTLLLLLCGALVGGITPRQAGGASQSDKLPASHDAVLDPNNPTTTYATALMEATYSNFPAFVATRRSLLQFDLAATTAALTDVALVLQLVESNLSTGSEVTVALYGADDGWTESAVTWANGPATGNLLQSMTIAAGFLGPVRFDAAAVRAYLTTEQAGDGVASFLLVLTGGSGALGFGGNLLFENREGGHDGVNGNEPFIALPPTSTVTPSATVSATATPTEVTPAPSVTVTPSATAAATATTVDATPTPTLIATAVETPIATPTITVTAMATPATITPTISATPTASATPTSSPTAGPTSGTTPGLYLPLINK